MSTNLAIAPPDPELDYIAETCRVLGETEKARRIGRPSTMTPRAVRKILEALERGNFLQPASALASVPYRTVQRWCEEGRADETESTPQYYFWRAVETAQATDEDVNVGRIRNATQEARFYMGSIIHLSRRHRERWAERTADELKASQQPTVQVLIGVAPPGTPQNPLPVTIQARRLEPAE